MKNLLLFAIFTTATLVLFTSCKSPSEDVEPSVTTTKNSLAPPDWLQGAWIVDDTPQNVEYRFTATTCIQITRSPDTYFDIAKNAGTGGATINATSRDNGDEKTYTITITQGSIESKYVFTRISVDRMKFTILLEGVGDSKNGSRDFIKLSSDDVGLSVTPSEDVEPSVTTTKNSLAPPDWLQGAWIVDDTPQNVEYRFTATTCIQITLSPDTYLDMAKNAGTGGVTITATSREDGDEKTYTITITEGSIESKFVFKYISVDRMKFTISLEGIGDSKNGSRDFIKLSSDDVGLSVTPSDNVDSGSNPSDNVDSNAITTKNSLAPPEWLQGTWIVDDTPQNAEFRFTATTLIQTTRNPDTYFDLAKEVEKEEGNNSILTATSRDNGDEKIYTISIDEENVGSGKYVFTRISDNRMKVAISLKGVGSSLNGSRNFIRK